ncbi:MAG: universal stress protein [Ignavibacteriaceae bacterium]
MKTIKMKKILIALDYNPTAQKVAEIGFSMAKAMNAEVILLHVISDPVVYSSVEYSPIMGMSFTGYTNMELLQLETVEGLKKASQIFLDKSKQHLGDKTIETLIREGDCAETIVKTADELHIDIIVMGSHSRRWLENIVMGSVAEKVLHNTSIPLFIIPTKQNK